MVRESKILIKLIIGNLQFFLIEVIEYVRKNQKLAAQLNLVKVIELTSTIRIAD